MTHNREVKSSSLFIATIYSKTSSIKNANHSVIGFFLPDFCQVASSSASLILLLNEQVFLYFNHARLPSCITQHLANKIALLYSGKLLEYPHMPARINH